MGDELEEKIHQISNKFILDVYENNRSGRNSIRAGMKMNKALEELIQQEIAKARIDELEGCYDAVNRLDVPNHTNLVHNPYIEHHNNRITELSQTLKELEAEL